jgi:hypothetical protein
LTFSLTESNTRSTVVVAPATTKGWSANATCWIVRKGGTC